MTTRSVLRLSACATLLLLSACSFRGPIIESGPCKSGVCKVDVTVVNCAVKEGFTVSEPDLRVGAPNRIEWTLVSAGYSFGPYGIDIKKNDGVFEDPKVMGGGKKFSWHDRHNTAPGYASKYYYYAINVVKDDGSVTCGQFDPRISNF